MSGIPFVILVIERLWSEPFRLWYLYRRKMAHSRRIMSIMLICDMSAITVLIVDCNIHSWFTSVCYTSRCNVSEVSIDLSDVECIERSNALAVSNGRCAGNRSSDGQLRFRKLPIRYRGATICKNGNRRWLMREWLENSILRKKATKKKKKRRARHRNFRLFRGSRIFELHETNGEFNRPHAMPRPGNKYVYACVRENKNNTIVLHRVFPVCTMLETEESGILPFLSWNAAYACHMKSRFFISSKLW